MESQDKNTAKKNYKSPQLIIYGNISELTQNVSNTGAVADNPVMKT